ncbi:MAG: hypothetical protein LBC18_10750, partial [Opitutaceae bacterium]|nr:hypothetical protein [Opitutaceae bacterium]
MLKPFPPQKLVIVVGLKKGHSVVGGVTTESTAALIKARAAALDLTPSKFIGLLLKQWVNNG